MVGADTSEERTTGERRRAVAGRLQCTVGDLHGHALGIVVGVEQRDQRAEAQPPHAMPP